MLLNRVEYALMNNPIRAAVQRRFEAGRLIRMGGPMRGGVALEVGCGRGVGAALILDLFGADAVDAFDLDPRMVALARESFVGRASKARFWVGDATSIPTRGASYDAVFDFGIIHHVPRWRDALREIHRVLAPGGRFYAEEILRPFLENRAVRQLLEHPREDRFDRVEFCTGLREAGLELLESEELWGAAAWFVAVKPKAA